MNKRWMYLIGVFVLGGLLLFLLLANIGTTLAGSPYTVCSSGCDFTSVQAAIDAASSGDTILLGDEIFTEMITIPKSLTLQGAGVYSTVLQAASAPGSAPYRVVSIPGGLQVTMTNMTIRHGMMSNGQGGGIYSKSSLRLNNVNIASNQAKFSGGVGVDFCYTKAFSFHDVSFIDNRATDGDGGGIAIQRCNGEIENAYFYDNVADDSGGAIFNYAGNIVISNTVVYSNKAVNFNGAGFFNFYTNTVQIFNSAFYSNTALNNSGGGIFNYFYAVLEIDNTAIYSNVAYDAGGIGIVGDAVLTLTNSTVSGNRAQYEGGGIRNSGMLVMQHVTVVNNDAVSGGGIHTTFNGKTDAFAVIATDNTLVDCDGSSYFVDLGYNIMNTPNGCLTQPTSVQADPKVGPLKDNGGDTWTHALLTGSPAIDLIPENACQEFTDQRGIIRPYGSGCDSGAYEVAFVVQIVKSADETIINPGDVVTYTVVLKNLADGFATGSISDALSPELVFLGNMILEPSSAGVLGSSPPLLVSDIHLGVNESLSLTYQAQVTSTIGTATTITNTAVFSQPMFLKPFESDAVIEVVPPAPSLYEIYLPNISR